MPLKHYQINALAKYAHLAHVVECCQSISGDSVDLATRIRWQLFTCSHDLYWH